MFSINEEDTTTRPNLVERSNDLKLLEEAWDRAVMEETSEFVSVSSEPGNGRTALVGAFHEKCLRGKDENGNALFYYCHGKFDLSLKRTPFGVLRSALEELCHDIHPSELNKLKAQLRSAVGNEARELVSIIPALASWLTDHSLKKDSKSMSDLVPPPPSEEEAPPAPPAPPASAVTSSMKAPITLRPMSDPSSQKHRVFYLFRSLVRVVTQTRPLVMFFDDIHWADAASLRILSRIATDPRSKRLLMIVSHRDETTPKDANVTSTKQLLSDVSAENANITLIFLSDLSQDGVNKLLSQLLETEQADTRPLADLVHTRTRGNVFFVHQFVKALKDHKLLRCNSLTSSWEWDDPERIKEDESLFAENVVDLLEKKIQQLDPAVKVGLQVASCISSNMGVQRLQWLLEGTVEDQLSHINPSQFLKTAAEEGLMVPVGNGQYRFAHNRVRQASYSTIPEGHARNELHKKIGYLFLRGSDEPGNRHRREWMRHTAVDQLDKAEGSFEDEACQIELAALNLEAGEGALSNSAFLPASHYLQTGIRVLDRVEDAWDDHYELAVSLHQTLADVLWTTGQPKQSEDLARKIAENAISIEDKIPAFLALARALGAQEKTAEAVKVEINALKVLGVYPRFPEVTIPKLVHAVRKRLLQCSPSGMLETHSDCKDKKMISAMKVLLLMSSHTAHRDDSLSRLISVVLNVNMALIYGLHEASAPAFAQLAVLALLEGKTQEAQNLRSIYTSLATHFGIADAFTSYLLHFWVEPWFRPLTQTLDPLLESFQKGILKDDVRSAAICFNGYMTHYYMAGLALQPLLQDAKEHLHLLEDHGLMLLQGEIRCLGQAVWNLVYGYGDDAKELDGEYMDSETFHKLHGENQIAQLAFHRWRMELSFYFGELDTTDVILERLVTIQKKQVDLPYSMAATVMYFNALVPLAQALENEDYADDVDMDRINKAIASMENAVQKQNRGINLVPRLRLLLAGRCALDSTSKHENVRLQFNRAISMAGRSGVRQDAAVGNLLAGMCCWYLHDDLYWAANYLSTSIAVFRDWGAESVASHLQDKFGDVLDGTAEAGDLDMSISSVGSSNHRGRTRLDPGVIRKGRISMNTYLRQSRPVAQSKINVADILTKEKY